MKRLGMPQRILVVSGLVALALAGCAAAQHEGMVSKDPVGDRQRMMRLIGASWADIQAKVKAGNIEGVAVNAETIAVTAGHIPALFPKDSLSPQSKAKPEIWQKWEEFKAIAKTTEGLAATMRDKARAKDKAGVEAAVKEFGAKACAACHTPFRMAQK
jgi:cytochrome c556